MTLKRKVLSLPKNARTVNFHKIRLPVELEREIFELAASSYPKCVPKFILVARRVHTWLEPELYRIMRSGEGRVIPPLYTGGKKGDSDVVDFDRLRQYGCHIRHILLQNRTSQEIGGILECCPKVYNLALWIVHGSCAHLIPILEGLTLQRLSFDPSYFFENYKPEVMIPFDQPLFHNLTHLEIIIVTSAWSKWNQLARLPKLTHLALGCPVYQSLIDHVLAECMALKIFVMFHLPMRDYDGKVVRVQKDHRVVFLRKAVYCLEHWESGARGEEHFWITAERCISIGSGEGPSRRLPAKIEWIGHD